MKHARAPVCTCRHSDSRARSPRISTTSNMTSTAGSSKVSEVHQCAQCSDRSLLVNATDAEIQCSDRLPQLVLLGAATQRTARGLANTADKLLQTWTIASSQRLSSSLTSWIHPLSIQVPAACAHRHLLSPRARRPSDHTAVQLHASRLRANRSRNQRNHLFDFVHFAVGSRARAGRHNRFGRRHSASRRRSRRRLANSGENQPKPRCCQTPPFLRLPSDSFRQVAPFVECQKRR